VTAARWRRDEGTALIEFVFLAVLLMIPLVYVALTALSVQRAAFGITAAAREAGRAYATGGSDAAGERRAELAATTILADQGVEWDDSGGRVVSCAGTCTYAPGSSFTATLSTRVALPLVPSFLCRSHCVAAITVHASHSERLSCYSGTGTPVGSTPDGVVTGEPAEPEGAGC
jgi:Flp pilus assembly protein TadG